MEWYKKSKEEILTFLKTDKERGLSKFQVKERLELYGLNITRVIPLFSFGRTFVGLLWDPLIFLLAAASLIIFFAGDPFDSWIILGIILLNATIGTFQERRIALMVDRLRSFKKQQSTVVRDGIKCLVDDHNLVPGDIVILQEGEHVPADARILESYGVTVDEAVLTGESRAVSKQSEVLTTDCELSEQSNMLFGGSYLVTGYVLGVIIATGVGSEGRRYSADVEVFSHQMPLQRDLSLVLKFVLWLIVFICASLFVIGIVAGKPFPELLAALIALFMCVVPQGLPVIMTIILVSGAYVMARHKVVAKRLQAIEALGRAQVALLDKTGTLTKNELMVVAIQAEENSYSVTGAGYHPEGFIKCEGNALHASQGNHETLHRMMEAALLLDRSVLEWHQQKKKWTVKGSVNEAALRMCAQKYGLTLQHVESQYKKLYEIPFGSEHQYHVGFYEKEGKGILFGIGSLESIGKRSSQISSVQRMYGQTLLDEGLRVLAFAVKEFSLSHIPLEKEHSFFTGLFDEGLVFLGTVGISDTLRENVSQVISHMQRAGIQVVMATGDSSKTAFYMARLAGIIKNKNHQVMEGATFHHLSDQKLASFLASTVVYARLLPADKVRLVSAFQNQGKVVMVVGDGVNDVPALMQANVSLAMAGTGSEAAKEAAHILLLDDAFEKIVHGIEHGRHIFYTFKRVILYFFTTNFAEVLVMLFSLAGGYPVPLLACQILWLNLVTDGFLDTALSLEPVEKNLMHGEWLQDQTQLMTKALAVRVLYSGFLAAVFSCGVFAWYLPVSLELARTMTMVTLTACQWVTALNCRSLDHSLFTLSPFSNRWLALALGGIFVTQIAIVTVPFLRMIFKTVPLSVGDWAIVCCSGLLLVLIEEVRKKIKRSSKKAY
jgi:magnesium-transporting ATPase (P-type)